MVGRAGRQDGVDLQGHADRGPNKADQMGDHFVGDLSGVTARSNRVKLNRAMESTREARRLGERRIGCRRRCPRSLARRSIGRGCVRLGSGLSGKLRGSDVRLD